MKRIYPYSITWARGGILDVEARCGEHEVSIGDRFTGIDLSSAHFEGDRHVQGASTVFEDLEAEVVSIEFYGKSVTSVDPGTSALFKLHVERALSLAFISKPALSESSTQ